LASSVSDRNAIFTSAGRLVFARSHGWDRFDCRGTTRSSCDVLACCDCVSVVDGGRTKQWEHRYNGSTSGHSDAIYCVAECCRCGCVGVELEVVGMVARRNTFTSEKELDVALITSLSRGS